MYDDVLTLKVVNSRTYDADGNETITYTDRTVYTQPRGIYRAEFYSAAQLGLQPSITFFLANRADYQGEKILVYRGQEYEIIRTDWNAQRDGITLICEARKKKVE